MSDQHAGAHSTGATGPVGPDGAKANQGEEHGASWTATASKHLGSSESIVLSFIGVALVLVALLLLYSSMHDLWLATTGGAEVIEKKAIEILNTILLVMMTMEIVYTVAISLKSHTLNAEPFLIIGTIAGIRRMLVITATSTELDDNPAKFQNTLVELGLLAATVVAMTIAIWILRYSQRKYVEPAVREATGPAASPAILP